MAYRQTYDNYFKDYYAKNKERINLARKKKYRETNKNYYDEHKIDPKGVISYTREWKMWYGAKKRAEQSNLPFNLELSDIVIPEICPVLGIKLDKDFSDKSKMSSPSLDKIVPSLGYVKDNICVISMKANSMKRDLTEEVLEKLLNYIRKTKGL